MGCWADPYGRACSGRQGTSAGTAGANTGTCSTAIVTPAQERALLRCSTNTAIVKTKVNNNNIPRLSPSRKEG